MTMNISKDTIHCRITDMPQNIEQNTANSKFALQIDEKTGITVNVQLTAFIHGNYLI